MLFATAKQGALFVWMMAAGAAIGLWYALMAGLRRFIRAGFWLTLLCDMAFALGGAAIFMAFLLAGSYGQLRLFEIIAAALGALIFAGAAAAPLKWLENTIQKLLRRIVAALSGNRLIKVIFK